MNFRQFEAIYWIARLGSFHAAARHLKTSQPAISARIREIERELGVELFDRSGRSARPTAKGHELLHYAEQIMAMSAEIQQRVGTKEALSGLVRLGVTAVPAVTWMPTLLRRLARTYPGIVVEFAVDSSETLQARMLRGELDVAFMAGPISSPQVTAESLGKVDMAWLASPDLGLPLAPMSAADMALWPVITDASGSHLNELATEWFRAEGVEPGRHHSCSSLLTRIQLAVAGLGVAMGPASAASRELAAGTLRVVATRRPLPAMEYRIVYAGIGLSPAAKLVALQVKDLIGETRDLQLYYSPEAFGR
ncbi:MAG: LysR family transcriptional regulator [Proteobacteria bacterium]|nr:LysR family transcriptional regulator [Pseudomonadota bacterium]